MGAAWRRSIRLAVVLGTLLGVLVPAWQHPVRALSFPITLARSVEAPGDGSIAFAFPPTHVAFSWRGEEATGVRYRLTQATGDTTRWRRASEAHDLKHGDHRYSGILYVNRPRAIEWRTLEPGTTDVSNVTVDYLNTLDGPERTVTVPATAGAVASTPHVVTRAEWGADESLKRASGSCTRSFFPLQQLFVHHTAGTNHDPHPRATMRAIYWYHVVRRGWCDVAYNFVLGPKGTIYEGRWARRFDPWEVHDSEDRRDRAVVGAHTSGYNSGSAAISLMGNYSQVGVPAAAREKLVKFLAWEADRHNLNPTARHTYENPDTGLTRRLHVISGHRDAGQTECPGENLYDALPGIREDVAQEMGIGKRVSEMFFTAITDSVQAGDPATFVGRLTTRAGEGIPGRVVAIHARPKGASWGRVGKAATAVDGSFTFNYVPTKSSKLVAVFKRQDPVYWGSQSERVHVEVSKK